MYHMMIAALLTWLLTLGVVAAAEKKADNPDREAVVKGNNDFALELYGKLNGKEGNLFLSPNSISTALAMTYDGARGQTAEQMARALHFTLDQDALPAAYAGLVKELNGEGRQRGYQLNVANALWGQKGHPFLPAFLKVTRESYGAGLNQLDFESNPEAARQTINAWVEKETQDKIKDLLPPNALPRDTRLVLTNAIYFKGKWAKPFKKEQTRDQSFQLSAERKIDVPMMNQKGDFKYLDGGSFQALELLYQDKELSMVVFLPRKADGLADFEKSLTSANLAQWLSKMRQDEVAVSLPKFQTTAQFQLRDVLSKMGMPLAFQQGAADFSGMDGEKDLFISAVVHKAFVDVNEEGTEAAAATGVLMRPMMARITPVFRADHPFVFLIRDNRSGSILFLGRVANPRP